MKKVLIALLILLLLCGVCCGGVLFGAKSGLLSIGNLFKPKDLGVKFTDADLKSAQDKTKIQFAEVKSTGAATTAGETLNLSNVQPVKFTLSSEELTALVNNYKWKYFPAKDVQIKMDGANTEVSGMMMLDRVSGYASAIGYSQADIDSAFASVGVDKSQTVPFSIAGTFSTKDNVTTLDITASQIAFVTLPTDTNSIIKEGMTSVVASVTNKYAEKGTMIRSASIVDGKLVFDGTIPLKQEYEAE